MKYTDYLIVHLQQMIRFMLTFASFLKQGQQLIFEHFFLKIHPADLTKVKQKKSRKKQKFDFFYLLYHELKFSAARQVKL